MQFNSLLLVSLFACVVATPAQVTVFSDNFTGGSTVNALNPAQPTANSTSYQVIASKAWNPNPATLGAGHLKFGIVATTGGGVDLQALFTTAPVELLTAGNYIELVIAFTITAGVLTSDSQLGVGLFNASGVAPWGGGLANSANNANFAAAMGGAQNWQGYLAQLGSVGGTSGNSQFVIRPSQTNGDNRNQVTTVNGSTIYGFQNSTTIGTSSASPNVNLTVGGRYTEVVNLTRLGNGSLQLTGRIYTNNPSDTLMTTVTATTSTNPVTTAFDAFAIGWRSRGSTVTTIDIHSVQVSAFVQSQCVSAQFLNTTSTVVGQTNVLVNITLPTNATASGPLSVDLVSTNPAVAYPGDAAGGTLTVTFPQNAPYPSTNISMTAMTPGVTQFYLTNATPPACILATLDRSVVSVIASPPPSVPVRAFPGAEGFGALTVGGRGGDVYYVTNLGDSGPGSLRNGITSASGPRTIVFAVSGNIRLESILNINKPFLTIAGQTAPGDGICIRDYSVNIRDTRDIIIRGLRLRRGDVLVRAAGQPTGSAGLDTVSMDRATNVIFDHCSLSWSCDEIFGIVRNQNVTIQWCIISEPLGDPVLHPYGTQHAYGLNCSATTLSVHHNLIANYVIRGPQFEANDAVAGQGYEVWKEAVNNVLFDFRNSGSRYRAGVEEGAGNIPFRFHFIRNFYLRNPARTSAQEIEVLTNFGVTNTIKVHVSGNIGPSRPNDTLDQWALVKLDAGDVPIRIASAEVQAQMSDVPLFASPVPITEHSATNAYKQVISLAGYHQVRDSVDARVVSNVVNRQFFDYLQSQSQVGGWPELHTYDVPADTDGDGMPDYWETALGMNPYQANHNHTNTDGYTDLEHYLNWMCDLRAVGAANRAVDVNLRKFTLGLASNATYTVTAPTNGSVSLLSDGRTARFTPLPGFFGRAAFGFASNDTLAGGGITNVVHLLITPPPQPRFTSASQEAGRLIMHGVDGTPGMTYHLLQATNIALPPEQWSRVATNQFDAEGRFALTNSRSPDAAHYFYRLEQP